MFHLSNGLFIGRRLYGNVVICLYTDGGKPGSKLLFKHEATPSEWASVVATVSRFNETGDSHAAFLGLHGDGCCGNPNVLDEWAEPAEIMPEGGSPMLGFVHTGQHVERRPR